MYCTPLVARGLTALLLYSTLLDVPHDDLKLECIDTHETQIEFPFEEAVNPQLKIALDRLRSKLAEIKMGHGNPNPGLTIQSLGEMTLRMVSRAPSKHPPTS